MGRQPVPVPVGARGSPWEPVGPLGPWEWCVCVPVLQVECAAHARRPARAQA